MFLKEYEGDDCSIFKTTCACQAILIVEVLSFSSFLVVYSSFQNHEEYINITEYVSAALSASPVWPVCSTGEKVQEGKFQEMKGTNLCIHLPHTQTCFALRTEVRSPDPHRSLEC